VDITDIPTIFVSEEVVQNIYLGPQKTVEQWLADADDHHKNNRLEEALAAYEQAILLGHESADTAYVKGNLLYKLERYDEALLAYDQASQLGYKNPMVHYYRGYVLSLLNRYEEALTAYEQAIKLDSTKAMFHGGIGNVFRELKHYADALKAYEEAIRRSPRTPIFLYPQSGSSVYS
jgi:tetratricopeptide (TPR) repeat protein